MKKVLTVPFLIAFALFANAQTQAGTTGAGKAGTQVKKANSQAKGAGQYHGSKDTTPGSPMGTGGAGGNEMSGSPKGSAAESAIQPKKPAQQPGGQSGSQDTMNKKMNTKGKTTGKKSGSD